MTIRPSETASGRAWLTNFEPTDQALAGLLLDSVRFLSESRFRAGLSALLRIVVENRELWPVAIYPVRPKPSSAELTGAKDAPGLFEPDPNRPWLSAGSEHLAANIITEVTKNRAPTEVMGSVTQPELRDRRVRTLVFVDDYIGSGGTVLGYVKRWWANPTIKSWHSGRFVRAHLVCYGMSTRAEQQLTAAPPLLADQHSVEFGLDFTSANWSATEREGIRRICTRYAVRNTDALGWRGSEGLFVMGHTTPNNLPAILRQETGRAGSRWRKFFPPGARRLGATQQLLLADYAPRDEFAEIVKALGHPDLERGYRDGTAHQIETTLVTVLAALSAGCAYDTQLQAELRMSVFKLHTALRIATSLGLIDENRHLTDRGHEALRRAGRDRRRVREILTPKTGEYYPLQLR